MPRRDDQWIQRDVDDEIRFHIESRVSELMARGQPEESARRIAELEFGDLRAARRELAAVDRHRRRRERIALAFDAIRQELRHSVRSLRRSSAFTIAAVLTLVIGIGSSATIFTVVNGVLLRPLPYRDPDRLVGAWHDLPGVGMTHQPQTVSTYFTYRRLAHSFTAIGVYRSGEANIANIRGAAEPVRVTSASISATLVRVLDVEPMMGRAFTDEDDCRGAPPVVLIDEDLWRTRFDAAPRVLGQRLDVNGIAREIVGVMPARFHFPSAATQLWIPIQLDPFDPPIAGFQFSSVGRLKPGVSIIDAERDLATVLPRAPEMFPKFVPGISTQQIMNQVRPQPVLVPLREDITGGIAGTLLIVSSAAALLLLVASANVINLMLVRVDAQQHEIAVREALGAGRGRGTLHYFVECAVVAGAAAVLGLGAAAVSVRALVHAAPAAIPRLTEVSADMATVLFTLVVAAIVATGCTALATRRIGPGRSGMREGVRRGIAGRGQHLLRGGLVAAQVALAFVVLAGAGLLIRTHARLNAVRPGFDPERVSTFWISLPVPRYGTDADVVAFYSRLIDRVASLPGVAVVGLTSRLPLETHGQGPNPLYPENDPSYVTKLPPLQLFTAINGDYFRAMGIPLLVGRTFDRMNAQRDGDAIVSLSTAQFFWKDPTGVAALGKRFRPLPTDRSYTVIGVVGDVRDTTLSAVDSPTVYFPEIAVAGSVIATKRTMALVVRSTSAEIAIAPAVQQAVRALDPAVPTFDVRPMAAVLKSATTQLSFVILVLSSAAVVTLILAAVGLYGVLAYIVTRRTRELSIRIALGASPRGVAATMTRYGITLTGAGVVIGLALFAFVARFLGASLYGVAPTDPVTLGGAALAEVAIAIVAGWLPAHRAARVSPIGALRSE